MLVMLQLLRKRRPRSVWAIQRSEEFWREALEEWGDTQCKNNFRLTGETVSKLCQDLFPYIVRETPDFVNIFP